MDTTAAPIEDSDAAEDDLLLASPIHRTTGLADDVLLRFWHEHHTGRPGWYTAGRGVFVGRSLDAIAASYGPTRLRLQAAGYVLAAPSATAVRLGQALAAAGSDGDAAALAAAEAELAAVRELPAAQRGPCYRQIFDAAADRVMLLHQSVRHGAGKAQAIANAFCAIVGDGVEAVVAAPAPTLAAAADSAPTLAAAEAELRRRRRRRPSVAVDGRVYPATSRRPAEALLTLSCAGVDGGDLMAAARAARACAHFVASALLERPDYGDGNVVEVLPGAHRSVDGAAYCLLRVMVAVSEAPGVIATAREVAAEWSAAAIDRRS